MSSDEQPAKQYVGAIVGESTSSEFRLAVNPEAVHEQDIIALDAELRDSNKNEAKKLVRVWAKVQRIERLNPLFPVEAGHELAHTRTNPFDTVLSLSREMITAVCQVLGWEPRDADNSGKLNQLRYPPRPASDTYSPASEDIARIVVGELADKQALDIATLANRDDVDVKVNGHAIVTRHLAILAMTGAGKSWTSRRIIEQLALKKYPIIIFDPRGDYTGLADVGPLKGQVKRYYAQFPVFEEDSSTVAEIVSNIGYSLTDTMNARFDDVFHAAKAFYVTDVSEMELRTEWLAHRLNRPDLSKYGMKRDMWLIASLAEAGELVLRDGDAAVADKQKLVDYGWANFASYSKTDSRTLEGIKKRAYRAASALRRMEEISKNIAGNAEPLPVDRTELVKYGQLSIVALAGYTGDFQATICSLIASDIFDARVSNSLNLPVLMVLEEAHNFIPAKADTAAEKRSTEVIRQIAQEGRKFRIGLIIISQRPSRLDETTLSMCNSFVIMRMVNPADQNFVRKVMETLGEDDVRLLPNLDKGEALLSGQMINFPVLAKMKAPQSQGEREETDAFEALEKDFLELEKTRKQTH